jgi:KipI family sensor histidine kinase inhibitor
MSGMRLLPVGPYALLAEVGDSATAQALYAALAVRRSESGDLSELVELVPAARTVLAVAQPTDAGNACLARLSEFAHAWDPALAADPDTGPLVDVPVSYAGPDLAGVAALVGVAADEVVRRHTAADYRVAFCGFAPGFAYLSGLPAELQVPRLAEPRTRVPAGSVGLAGEFCGMYPRESPGGWQLIGRTDAVLFDPEREPAALLAPGTRVRFHPVP